MSVGRAVGARSRRKRRKAQGETLAADEAPYRQIFDAVPAYIWTSRPDGALEYCNQWVLDYTQCSLEQLEGNGWLKLVHPADRERVQTAWERAVATGERHEIEYRMCRAADRTYRWLLVRGQPQRDALGNIVRWCGTGLEIEKRKRVERALESSEALLRQSQRTAHVGSYMVEVPDPGDRTRDRVHWSDELYRIFGYESDRAALNADAVLAVVHPDDRERVTSAIAEAFRRLSAFELEYRIIRNDGVHTLYGWGEFEAGSPLRLWGTCQDVTEQRHAATALREADRRKNEFLAILAHELRNPLAPIRQAASVARSPQASEAQRQRAFEIIERQVAHMARLLEDLLEASRISHGRLALRRQPTTLQSALLSAIETARPLIEARGHSLSVDTPAESIWLDGDPVRLAQLFTNLLTNAAKYTDPHGRISLKVRTRERQVIVSVRDNGIGISPELLPRVFDLFSQAHPALERTQGGLGIGLALARGLATLHGGSIEAHSEGAGRGSEFRVHLPILLDKAEPPAAPDAPEANARRSRRVLVADDNPDAADSLAMTLRLLGHEVEVAHDGRQALAIAAIFHPEIGLLDIGMPEFNGYDLARQIRAEPWGQHMQLIAVTGWSQEEDRRRALEAGFDDHLTKPIDPEGLGKLID